MDLASREALARLLAAAVGKRCLGTKRHTQACAKITSHQVRTNEQFCGFGLDGFIEIILAKSGYKGVGAQVGLSAATELSQK